MKALAAAFLLAAAGAAGHVPIVPAPTIQPAAPTPLAPPTNRVPGPAPPTSSISPLLLGPGAQSAAPAGPLSGLPSPIDQEKLQTYREDLENQRRALEREGVSPADPRYRDIQQQLQLYSGPGSP